MGNNSSTPVTKPSNNNSNFENHQNDEICKNLYFRQGLTYFQTSQIEYLIGGSYALNKFTADTNWKPNDVDMFVEVVDGEQYKEISSAFEQAAEIPPQNILKSYEFTGPNYRKNLLSGETEQRNNNDDSEDFHSSIIATKTYKITDFDLPVQLVGIRKLNNIYTGLLAHLNAITDLPACVSYHYLDLTRQSDSIFHVPSKAIEALNTKTINYKDICKTRVEKYTSRGYTFTTKDL